MNEYILYSLVQYKALSIQVQQTKPYANGIKTSFVYNIKSIQ